MDPYILISLQTYRNRHISLRVGICTIKHVSPSSGHTTRCLTVAAVAGDLRHSLDIRQHTGFPTHSLGDVSTPRGGGARRQKTKINN